VTQQTRIKIGALLKSERVSAGLTQLELAKKFGYDSMQFVSLFERGLSQVPLKTIGRLTPILKLNEKQITKIVLDDYKKQLHQEIKLGKEIQCSNVTQ
jgi:transcriptional regulator with XRE-family HTH domain